MELPDEVLETITSCRLTASLAEELLPIKDKSKQSLLANLIIERRLSFRKARTLAKDFKKRNTDFETYHDNHDNGYSEHIKLAERSFDKTIIVLRIAMNRLREIINDTEHDWILYEILRQHKNMLHEQIDILIKEKRKFEN